MMDCFLDKLKTNSSPHIHISRLANQHISTWSNQHINTSSNHPITPLSPTRRKMLV